MKRWWIKRHGNWPWQADRPYNAVFLFIHADGRVFSSHGRFPSLAEFSLHIPFGGRLRQDDVRFHFSCSDDVLLYTITAAWCYSYLRYQGYRAGTIIAATKLRYGDMHFEDVLFNCATESALHSLEATIQAIDI